MHDYKLTIGLEIHAELSTETKMFCNSRNDTNESRPNTNICPVCMGYPGTLPVINKEAVRRILRLGVAVGGKLAQETVFDRKNYFYPDIPKGYQISQYKNPLVSGGLLRGVTLTRVHLEEDTARSSHEGTDFSLVDFNRAGVPLMELVTEPVMHTNEEATKFAKELQLLLQYLGISGANMEKGEMRVEANISVSRSDLKSSDSKVGPLGTKVEVKNINSFRAVGKAIEFEFNRQTELLDRGEKVVQETRGWDEDKEVTFSQRLKESAHDYRYFPDPDLPRLSIKEIPEFARTVLAKSMPELPWEKRERLIALGVTAEHTEIYVTDNSKGKTFDLLVTPTDSPKFVNAASNYIINEIKKPLSPEVIREVVKMTEDGVLSSRGAKEVFKLIPEDDKDARKFAEENRLTQESDREVLRKLVEEVMKEHPNTPVDYLVGQAMKKSGGRANPVILQELFNLPPA